MPLTERENFIRNARRVGPEWMPCRVSISASAWLDLKEEAEEIVLRHPILFPGYRKGQRSFDASSLPAHHRAGVRVRDAMGCVWQTDVDGTVGVVVQHPLTDWSQVKDWQPPSVQEGRYDRLDWDKIGESIRGAKARGAVASGSLDHGFFLLRLMDLCGFENVMMGFADDQPELWDLIHKLDTYNKALVDRYLALGVDVVYLPEDLGAQKSSMVSPATFRKWCSPSYRLLIGACKKAGALVHCHSDGHTMELMDIFAELGVDMVNPQDLVNGVENIRRECKGRFCIDLDVDRQKVVPFGTPKEIRELIELEVRTLGSPQGGLMLTCGIYKPTPPENLEAVCAAMEEFRTYWFDGRGKA